MKMLLHEAQRQSINPHEKCFNDHRIKLFIQPYQSLNLNSVENLQGELKTRVEKGGPQTLEELHIDE